jgi:heterodisulfide reductase subunit C
MSRDRAAKARMAETGERYTVALRRVREERAAEAVAQGPAAPTTHEAPVHPERAVFCPFASNGVCTGGCPSNRDRACVNGED